MASGVDVEVAGETLHLLAERAAYWPRLRTLLVADAHWGKAAAFRAAGIPLPGGTTTGTLERLERALARTGAERVVFLGDLLHARAGRQPRTLAAVAAWRARHRTLSLVLVRGNHDRQAGDPPAGLAIRCVDPPLVEPPFALAHHPEPSSAGYVLAGHLHPGVRLAGFGGLRERLHCYWFGAAVGVLPAFGEFTGLADIAPKAGELVYVVAGGEVIRVGA